MTEHTQLEKQGRRIDNDSFLNFQLDLLKTEISQIQEIIGRIDVLSQQIKNWTVLIWAGSISLIIGNSNADLKRIILVAAVIPFLFWMVDGHFRRRQRSFIYRNKKISDYLNSEEFVISFHQKRIKKFSLLDLKGRQYDKGEVKKFANLRRAMWFQSLRTFYLGLITVTIILQIILYPKSESKNLKSTLTQKDQDSLMIENQNKIITDIKAIRGEIDSLINKK